MHLGQGSRLAARPRRRGLLEMNLQNHVSIVFLLNEWTRWDFQMLLSALLRLISLMDAP